MQDVAHPSHPGTAKTEEQQAGGRRLESQKKDWVPDGGDEDGRRQPSISGLSMLWSNSSKVVPKVSQEGKLSFQVEAAELGPYAQSCLCPNL